ncbi:MAG: polysaccharide biosynthesis/export family protein [Luteibaculaceae bacterium]
MFKADRDFPFDTFPDKEDPEYKLAPNDLVTVKIFSNDGFILIDMLAMMGGEDMGQRQGNQQMFMMPLGQMVQSYFIDEEGFVKLPIVGRVKIAGMSIWDAETFLEEQYAKYYIRPFAIVRVINNRAFVFTGAGGSGTIVPIMNNNTTLIEVLAMAGGLATRANAKRVKVFRQSAPGAERKIYELDLSTIEGIKYADMIIQANDIVYVEPMPFIVRQAAADLAPIVSVISSLTVIIAVLGTFNRN